MTANGSSAALQPLVHKRHLKLEFYNISYEVKSRKRTESILTNVCGSFHSGRLSAILGPSGAGKTTLLNVLSGFKDKGLKGTILVNGEERNASEFRKLSSYIPQNFEMLDHLTTKETIKVSADLKLGNTVGSSGKNEVVENIIKLFNLERCRDTLVGRLSGGEKKRLSIGQELVTNPPVMFFDEPTSGLDSVASFQIVTHLKRLAQDGRAIICVVHQPSSRLLSLFDDILVLSEGQCIYNGSLDEMINCLSKEGFVCPKYYNRADFALEVASKEHGTSLTALTEANQKKLSQLQEITVHSTDEKCNISALKNSLSKCKDHFKHGRRKYPVNCLQQFSVLTKRCLIAMSRDLCFIQLRVMCHILFGVLFGFVFWNVGSEASKILTNTSCLFFCVLFLFFGNSMPTVLSCTLETPVFLREHLNGWYSIEAYFFSKLLSDLLILFLCPTLLSSITYYMTGQPDDFGRFLMFWGICLLVAVKGHTLALALGCTFKMTHSLFLLPASTIPMLVFSGFFIRERELSSCLRPFTYISYFRYSLEGLVQATYGYNRTKLACSEPFCYYKNAEKFLQDFDMDGDRYGIDVMTLAVWTLFFQICFYISLHYKVRKSQKLC